MESGRLDWNTLLPFPVPDAASGTVADALIKEITESVAAEVDPERTDATGQLPDGLIDRLRDDGWFRLRNASALGGHELSDYDAFRLVERVCAVSQPVGQTLAIQNAVGAAALLAALPDGPLRAKVERRIAAGTVSAFAGTEPEGANNAWPGTTAVPTADGSAYLLSGEKVFTGNGDIADLLAVLATVPEDGHRRVGVFFVDTTDPGFRVRSRLEFMGSRGLHNAALTLDGVRVPREDALLGEPDAPRFPAPVGAIALLSALFFNAAPALAIARQCQEWSSAFVARRAINGRPLGEYDQIQRILATTAAEVFAMDTVVRWSLLDSGLTDRWFERSVTKNLCTVTAWRIVDRTMSLLGGEGFETARSKQRRGAEPLPLERLFRDARGLRVSGNIDFLLDIQSARLLLAGRYAAGGAGAADDVPEPARPTGLDPANEAHLRAAEQGLRRFERVCRRLIAEHPRPDALFGRQETLRLLGRISAELFSMCAVLARVASDTDDGAQGLTDVHCTAVRHRLAGLWRRLTATGEPDYAAVSRSPAAHH
ncbi:acyl-CoA dehydrogenase family protein [Streptomyces rubrogriseus]|uniref:acyl-CoA dehydrogenase family protein n=1 Tax=Streptomyces rubrogriseus TaxID=194673 RepID=UPI0036FCBCFE